MASRRLGKQSSSCNSRRERRTGVQLLLGHGNRRGWKRKSNGSSDRIGGACGRRVLAGSRRGAVGDQCTGARANADGARGGGKCKNAAGPAGRTPPCPFDPRVGDGGL